MSGLTSLPCSTDIREPVSMQILLKPTDFSASGGTGATGSQAPTANIPINLWGNYNVEISSVEWYDTSNVNTVLALYSSVLKSSYGPSPAYMFAVNNTTNYAQSKKVFVSHNASFTGHIDFRIGDPVNGYITTNGQNMAQMKYCLITLLIVPSEYYNGLNNNII